jgi:hypothetical protein
MDVELSSGESEALRQALRSYLSDLRMEIIDTDSLDYKRGLREERAALESVLAKLDDAASTSGRDADGRSVVRIVAVWTE